MIINKTLVNYISVCVFIITLIIFSYIYGIKNLPSLFFLITMYTCIIVIIYFTYGQYISKKLVDKQIYYVFKGFTKYNVIFKDYFDKIFNYEKIDIANDNNIEKKNKTIINNIKYLLSLILVIGITISFSIYLYTKNYKLDLNNNYNYFINYVNDVVKENAIILIIIIIIQLLFNYFITRNYVPLENNEILKILTDNIVKFYLK